MVKASHTPGSWLHQSCASRHSLSTWHVGVPDAHIRVALWREQVTEVFEQVAVTVSDSSQAGLDDMLQQLEQQRQAMSALAAGKADRQEIVSLQR